MTGVFQPGASIPEEALAAEFSASRTPVREALILLERQLLVTNEQNRGFRVASVSIDLIRSYFELARAMYPVMAELACARATDHEVDSLAALPFPSNAQQSVLAHYGFIRKLALCSRNLFIGKNAINAEGYHAMVRSSVLMSMTDAAAGAAAAELTEHARNVHHALATKDQTQVRDVTVQMIEGARVFLISHLV